MQFLPENLVGHHEICFCDQAYLQPAFNGLCGDFVQADLSEVGPTGVIGLDESVAKPVGGALVVEGNTAVCQ